MKLSDFSIGIVFHTCTGQQWRCTDIGTRTILAIEIKPDLGEAWFSGPPFAVLEEVFDESDMARAYRNLEEAIRNGVQATDRIEHPGFPLKVVKAMMKARLGPDTSAYPHKRLLRIDRVDATGNLLHPYAVERDGDGWRILVYRPVARDFLAMAEDEFIRLRPMIK
jgi:hypothetical protein